MAQLMEDPHVLARESVTTIEDEDLGPLKMQNLFFRLSETPGAIRHGGRRTGQDTEDVLGELCGVKGDELDALREEGVV
jgi:crotonobetainyl-CoA:carnitine CoA-transferase CaiB-like acyl-CoA transferase